MTDGDNNKYIGEFNPYANSEARLSVYAYNRANKYTHPVDKLRLTEDEMNRLHEATLAHGGAKRRRKRRKTATRKPAKKTTKKTSSSKKTHRCSAKTKDGKRCKSMISKGKRCHRH